MSMKSYNKNGAPIKHKCASFSLIKEKSHDLKQTHTAQNEWSFRVYNPSTDKYTYFNDSLKAEKYAEKALAGTRRISIDARHNKLGTRNCTEFTQIFKYIHG